ncbi:unnamed protein product [Penicillium camemberti]|uniref:Str. FM013 n=1 Tax=Penicillium camemberti (strain FM 013) TaxID=1429867 RepID=A0A0G4NZV7_PENC3|nr:unnamed protein product [Penicillium camemberti]
MSLTYPIPAFTFSANIIGQLENDHSRFRCFTAGTPYFEGFIAMIEEGVLV